jgi:hypothetical protein
LQQQQEERRQKRALRCKKFVQAATAVTVPVLGILATVYGLGTGQ